MRALERILAQSDEMLAASVEHHGTQRLAAMTSFMAGFEKIATAVAGGDATWNDVLPWVERISDRFISAYDALQDWQQKLGDLIYGASDEERLERALEWRSQHALARELFHGTQVEEMLRAYEDEGVDRDLRERADGYGLYAPRWAPASHSWWKQPSE